MSLINWKLPARHPIKEEFDSFNRHDSPYDTKGHAVSAFKAILDGWGLRFDSLSGTDFTGDEGWTIIPVVNENNWIFAYAHLSWYRLSSGQYKFTIYLT